MEACQHCETESGHSLGTESFEVTYWADRFGVSVDQVREVLSQVEHGNLNDSLLERFC
jgi:hypothetical protein